MRIEEIETRRAGETVRTDARIVWEDASREPFALFFESDGPAAKERFADSNALLLAAALTAMRHGERRIAIDGPVCPRLARGLRAAATLLRSWYGGSRSLPAIEPAKGFAAPFPAASRRAGAFLSGGVDSLDVFLRNRMRLPPGHPARIEDALHVSGLPWTGPPGSPSSESFVARGRSAAAAIAAGLGVPVTFVRTNLGALDPDFLFFRRESFASAYAAIAHLFAARLTEVSYASAQQLGRRLDPLGSHPLLDPLYSSGALEFRHEGADRTRFEKAESLARRPELLGHLHVCLTTPLDGPGANCGRCEKCLHTQIELLLAGASVSAFPRGLLTAGSIRALRPDPHTAFFWRPLPERLRRAGRPDLAEAAERKLAEMDRVRAWTRESGWKARLRRFDREHLGSALISARRALRFRPAEARTP